MLKVVLCNVPVIVELVGSAIANQSFHIDGQDGEGKVKFVLQLVLTRLMFTSKESPNHVG